MASTTPTTESAAPTKPRAGRRPIGVLIVAIVVFFGGLLTFLSGLPSLFPWLAAALGFFEVVPFWTALSWVILGLITMGVAVALARLRMWAWWIILIINLFAIVTVLVTTPINYLALVWPVLIVLILLVARRYFVMARAKPVAAA